jgi:hypothetical protein
MTISRQHRAARNYSIGLFRLFRRTGQYYALASNVNCPHQNMYRACEIRVENWGDFSQFARSINTASQVKNNLRVNLAQKRSDGPTLGNICPPPPDAPCIPGR